MKPTLIKPQTVWRCQHGRAIVITDRQPAAPHGPCCPWVGPEQCTLSTTGEMKPWDDDESEQIVPTEQDLRIVARYL